MATRGKPTRTARTPGRSATGTWATVYRSHEISVSKDSMQLTLKMFQWAIFSVRPLQLREWRDVFAFISHPGVSRSLKECRESTNFIATDDQLERKIRSLSKGLLEVVIDTEEPAHGTGAGSFSRFAGAGSFRMNPGETRVIRAIHESVNEYFKSSRGFAQLYKYYSHVGRTWSQTNGHIAIMSTCLDYLEIPELDALVHAQIGTAKRERDAARSRAPIANWRRLDTVPWTARADESGGGAHGDIHKSPIGPAGIDIELWLSGVVPGDPSPGFIQSITHTDENDHPAAIPAKTPSQFLVQFQRLETYPALLNYATDEFLAHATFCLDDCDFESRLWDPARAEIELIMKRLNKGNLYRRWLALREELDFIYPTSRNRAISFSDYLSKIDSRFGLLLPGKGAQEAPTPTSPTTDHRPSPSPSRSADTKSTGLLRRLPVHGSRSQLGRRRRIRSLSESDASTPFKSLTRLGGNQQGKQGKHPVKTQQTL